MAEIRKHQPGSGEGIGRLVREALGETIRPVTPGTPQPDDEAVLVRDAVDDHAVSTLPTWVPDGPTLNF